MTDEEIIVAFFQKQGMRAEYSGGKLYKIGGMRVEYSGGRVYKIGDVRM